jgi:hypothetical protein
VVRLRLPEDGLTVLPDQDERRHEDRLEPNRVASARPGS